MLCWLAAISSRSTLQVEHQAALKKSTTVSPGPASTSARLLDGWQRSENPADDDDEQLYTVRLPSN